MKRCRIQECPLCDGSGNTCSNCGLPVPKCVCEEDEHDEELCELCGGNKRSCKEHGGHAKKGETVCSVACGRDDEE